MITNKIIQTRQTPLYANHKNQRFGGIEGIDVVFVVLSYYGDREDVSNLMQKMSHTSRNIFKNSIRAEVCLVRSHVILALQKAIACGKIEELTKYQCIDIDSVMKQLVNMSNNIERLAQLASDYPCLFIYVTKEVGLNNALW